MVYLWSLICVGFSVFVKITKFEYPLSIARLFVCKRKIHIVGAVQMQHSNKINILPKYLYSQNIGKMQHTFYRYLYMCLTSVKILKENVDKIALLKYIVHMYLNCKKSKNVQFYVVASGSLIIAFFSFCIQDISFNKLKLN